MVKFGRLEGRVLLLGDAGFGILAIGQWLAEGWLNVLC